MNLRLYFINMGHIKIGDWKSLFTPLNELVVEVVMVGINLDDFCSVEYNG